MNTPGEFEAMMLRLHARRVAGICALFGEPVPAGAAAILADDNTEQERRDNEVYAAWCERHGLEVVMFEDGAFQMVADHKGAPGRVLGPAH